MSAATSAGAPLSVSGVQRLWVQGPALALLTAPALLVVGFGLHLLIRLVDPARPEQSYLQRLTEAGLLINGAHVVLLFALPLLVPVVLVLMGLLRGRQDGLALLGGSLAVTGLVFLGALFGAQALAPSALATLPPEQLDALEPAWAALEQFRGWMPVAALGFAFQIGLAILAAGLFRARAVPRPAALAIGTGALLLLFDPIDPIMFTGSLLLLAGLAPIARRQFDA